MPWFTNQKFSIHQTNIYISKSLHSCLLSFFLLQPGAPTWRATCTRRAWAGGASAPPRARAWPPAWVSWSASGCAAPTAAPTPTSANSGSRAAGGRRSSSSPASAHAVRTEKKITLWLESCADFWALGVDPRLQLQAGFNKSLTSASSVGVMIGWNQLGVDAWQRLQAPKNQHKIPAISFPLKFFAFMHEGIFNCVKLGIHTQQSWFKSMWLSGGISSRRGSRDKVFYPTPRFRAFSLPVVILRRPGTLKELRRTEWVRERRGLEIVTPSVLPAS